MTENSNPSPATPVQPASNQPATPAAGQAGATTALPRQAAPEYSHADGKQESPSTIANKPGADSGEKNPGAEGENDRRMASRFAELARRDKAIRQEKRRLAEEKARLARWQEAESLAKQDPLAVLERLGLSYEQLTERQFQRFAEKAQKDDPNFRLKSIEDKIREYEEQAQRQQQEMKKAEVDRQLAQFKRQVADHVESNKEKFELVSAQRAHEDVYGLIEAHFAQTGEVMSIDQAATLVEQQLEEEAEPLLKAKKLRAKLGLKEQDAGQTGDLDQKTERSGVKATAVPTTLTNGNTVASQAGMPKAAFDIEESKRRAAAMLKFK